jgi:hypothetical protein
MPTDSSSPTARSLLPAPLLTTVLPPTGPIMTMRTTLREAMLRRFATNVEGSIRMAVHQRTTSRPATRMHRTPPSTITA